MTMHASELRTWITMPTSICGAQTAFLRITSKSKWSHSQLPIPNNAMLGLNRVSHETVEGSTVTNNHTNTMARRQNLLTRTMYVLVCWVLHVSRVLTPDHLGGASVCDGYNSKRPSAFSWLFERLVEEIPTRPAIATTSDYDTIKRVLSIYSGFIEHVKIRRWANQVCNCVRWLWRAIIAYVIILLLGSWESQLILQ